MVALAGVIGVLREHSAEAALEQARAALDAGLAAVEVTFTVPNAPRVIEALAGRYSPARVGAGTLLTPEDVSVAAAAGASLLVSPHLDEALVAAAHDAVREALKNA